VFIMTLQTLEDMATVPTARAALAGSLIYATSAAGQLPGSSLHGLDIVPTMGFTSEAKLAAALTAGKIPSGIRALMYDNEDWVQTPAGERLNPIGYYRMAAQLAHAHGYQLVATPGWIPGNKGIVTMGMDQRPVASTIIPAIARFVNVIDIQAQEYRLQSDLQQYLAWIEPIVKAAKAANPKVIILSGLSTVPAGGPATPQQLLTIADGTRDIVQGWWLNAPSGTHHPNPKYGIATQFLTMLGPKSP